MEKKGELYELNDDAHNDASNPLVINACSAAVLIVERKRSLLPIVAKCMFGANTG